MKFLVISIALLQSVFASDFSDLKVSTINMWGVPFQREMPLARCEALAREVSRAEYDLVFTQEVFSPNMRKTIRAYSDESFEDFYARPETLKLTHGLYNLSTFKIVKGDFRPFVDCGGIQCLAKKGIMYMQIELDNGRRVDTFNTHLQAFSENDEIRREQMQTLKSFVRQKNNGELPILLLGDFNISSKRSEYDVLIRELSFFRDAYREYWPNREGATWDPRNDWTGGSAAHRFDYIFYRDGLIDSWEVKNSYVEFDERLPWGRSNYVYVSDHYGVGAELRLNHH